ncbi:MAG: AlkA N-terminal domain-containing protein, partial [Solirubrobacteraceae bacterium]
MSTSSASGVRSRRSCGGALPFAAPLHAESLLGFLAARAVAGVEAVDGATYRRSVGLARGPA